MKFRLLPHIKENVYGFNRNSGQILGWEISKFNIPRFWDQTTGKGVRVGVIDTGCDKNHSDIKDNIVDGYNAIDDNDNFSDGNGHGTHVAGTIGAKNNSLGMVGVAPDSNIVPIKVLGDRGTGSANDIARGIRWAANNGCDIVTMSLGARVSSQIIENSISYAISKGTIVVCAAGNDGNNSEINFPARLSTTIAIGSINEYLEYSHFSCNGPELDFVSPGENIFSCKPGDNYCIMSGTSMATPFAVGCIALTIAYYKAKNKPMPKTIDSIIELFKKSSITLPQNINQLIIQPIL